MTPEKRCARKVTYLSESCAANAAFLHNLRNEQEGRVEVLAPDRCQVCGDWHLSPKTEAVA